MGGRFSVDIPANNESELLPRLLGDTGGSGRPVRGRCGIDVAKEHFVVRRPCGHFMATQALGSIGWKPQTTAESQPLRPASLRLLHGWDSFKQVLAQPGVRPPNHSHSSQ